MPYSKHFTATPPARATPWAGVRTYETAVGSELYTAIGDQTILADATPLTPDPASFDVDTCVLEVGLYRFSFLTGGGVESPLSAPVLSPGLDVGTGAPLCSLEDIDLELNRGGTASAYTTDAKTAARAAASAAFEREAGVAFTPRTASTLLRRSSSAVLFPNARVLDVAAVEGPDGPWADITGVYVDEGAVYGLGYASLPLTVTYRHGYEECPADVSRAVAILAGSILKDGPYDDRGYGVTDEGGTVRLMTAGMGSASFSIPDVQSALARYRVVFAL